jgi:Uma2 family endonuclease
MAITAVMTGLVFDELPYERGRLWELFDGVPLPMSSPPLEHQEIVFRLLLVLKNTLSGSSGKAATDVEFALGPNTRVRPDVWAVRGCRAPELDWSRIPVTGYPDLAVEVISPSESATHAMRKVELYLAHGVPEVWQVFADTRQVLVHTKSARVVKLTVEDAITTALFPDFEIRVGELFERP